MKNRNKGAAAILVLILIYLLIPLAVSIIYSLFSNWTGIVPRGFTLEAYKNLFSDREFLASLGRTILIAIVPIVVTILLMIPTVIAGYYGMNVPNGMETKWMGFPFAVAISVVLMAIVYFFIRNSKFFK